MVQPLDQIVVVEMGDDPQFTDELNNLTEQLGRNPSVDVVLDMRWVSYLNSANLGKLLKVRAVLIANKRRLFLAGMSTQVRQILLVVALDKIFDVADDTSIALASLQRRGSDLDNPRAGYRPSV
jgi:anti-anti-sigma factor